MSQCHHHTCQTTALKAARQVCADAGARFTPQRQEVFELIWQSHKALTAAEIMSQMSNQQPPITYRALSFLKDVGLIHHITSLNAYVGCVHPQEDHHVGHMLVCTVCKEVTELSLDTVLPALEGAAAQTGFTPTQTHVEMLGVCARCQALA